MDFKRKDRQTNVRVCQQTLSEYFAILNRKEDGKLYVSRGSYHFALHPHSKGRKLADIFNLYTVRLLPFYVFIEHGYMQHASAGYLSH